MNRSQIFVDIVFVLVVSFFIHFTIHQHNTIQDLEHFNTVITERSRINDDQLREVMYSMINRSNENDLELAKNQGRSEGILVAIKDPEVTEEYHELWHDGYYRGMAQNEFSIETLTASSYEEGYHSGIEDALRDSGEIHPEYTDREQTQDISEPSILTKAEIIKGRAKLRATLEPEFDKKIKDLIDDQKVKLTKE
jgi:hypothetical protein